MGRLVRDAAYARGQRKGMFLKEIKTTSFNPQAKAVNAVTTSHCFSTQKQLDAFEKKVREAHHARKWKRDW